jgi:hypothetical protein
MKLLRILFLLAALILAVTARPQRTNGTTAPNAPETQQSQPPPTVASALERDISAIEKANCGCCRSHAIRRRPCL